ncbi:hypothetical protein E5720_17615 [Rhodococcus sp. PAMC28707]|uniref:hypothetical protein n=1 Tax=unclassified Rhodococcus (in: high G+C Gram-positive bacteria) TaxID=192944 RepID=UPI00109DA6B9|nr:MULTISPECIES: hypothetical protein [unclassified Rhodococcus (in: high G+C Gram-positive bacteria)]QCB51797.1 hypothetical protein E5769_17910 [Rhodococcus sp. PAMC28705]QCB60035.1 hypothetical protein E5720_17615 [Rhodococcus sp. PAMC28707]
MWLAPDGCERHYAEVARNLQRLGVLASAVDVEQWRTGESRPQGSALKAVADVFPGDTNFDYLTSDQRAVAIHAQLALVVELVEGRVKDVRLRSEHEIIDRQELTELLKQLREHGPASQA